MTNLLRISKQNNQLPPIADADIQPLIALSLNMAAQQRDEALNTANDVT